MKKIKSVAFAVAVVAGTILAAVAIKAIAGIVAVTVAVAAISYWHYQSGK